jgi:hypothetical protein
VWGAGPIPWQRTWDYIQYVPSSGPLGCGPSPRLPQEVVSGNWYYDERDDQWCVPPAAAAAAAAYLYTI